MKILQLTYESFGSPFGFGGAGVRSYEIYNRIKERHDITLLSMKYPGVRDGEIMGLRHVFVGTESKNLVTSVLAYTVKAAAYIRKHGENFDIIVENFLPTTPFFTKYLTRTPSILQIQGVWGGHHIRKFNPFYGLPMWIMEKFYLAIHNTFLLVTRVGMDKLIKKSRIYAVIPNGINKGFFRVDREEGNYILFLSRIDTYQKGLDILLEAFLIIAEKFKGLKLILAGYEFSSTNDLFQKVPGELRSRVQYAGFVSGDERMNLLSKAKVFVLPSRHEAHPISILEALACGKAVIASDIPELCYVGENEIGLTFKSGSSRELSDKLSLLLRNKEMREKLGKRGREYASGFLWDDMALRFERFLIETAGRKDK
jgi:glycosyltransferase involved in cell wall biosynthesis